MKELFLYLPSFRERHSSRGNALLVRLLSRAEPQLREELQPRPGHCALSTSLRECLDLALFVCVQHSVADPIRFLYFYVEQLPITEIGRVSADSKLFLLVHLSEIWAACNVTSDRERDNARKNITICGASLLAVCIALLLSSCTHSNY